MDLNFVKESSKIKSPRVSSPLLQAVQPAKKPIPKQTVMTILLVFSLALNVYLLSPTKEPNPPSTTAAEARLQPLEPSADSIQNSSSGVSSHAKPKPVAHKSPVLQKQNFQVKTILFSPTTDAVERPIRSLQFPIRKSLNYTICSILSLKKGCRQLSAHVGRILVWFLDLNREMRQGDQISLAYEVLEGEDRFHILKLKYESNYHQEAFEANFYQIPGTRYGTYFDRAGKEIHPNLIDRQSPIRDFMGITSLPGDYRKGRFQGHRGTDFKAPTGTPVYATFFGKVIRRNWNTRSNGYSLEIDHPGKGVRTRYLHLSRTLVKQGETVRQGQKIAESGNTGRSFAPHLHYEIEQRGLEKNVINPFKTDKHEIYYRRIPDLRKEEFLQRVSFYNSLIQKW